MHTKTILQLFFLFIFSLTLTSCFDVVEEIDLKKNGSGKIKATLNLSKSKTKAASLMKLQKVDGIKIPKQAEIRQEMNTIVQLLKKTNGISNVQHSLDFTNFIATLSCDFEHVAALNAFNQALSKQFGAKLTNYTSYSFDAKSNVFERKYNHSAEAKKEFDKLSAESKGSFNDAFYTSIYRFEGAVKTASNSTAKISPNKKAVMLKTGILNLVNNKSNLSNRITLSN